MSNFSAKLHASCLFGAKGISRRRAAFWPLWLALSSAVVLLIFMDATGHAATAPGAKDALVAILGTSDVTIIYHSFLLAGSTVCLLQSQLLILRALREDRRQVLQLVIIGVHPRLILLAKGVEYSIHALGSALIGILLGGFAVLIILPSVVLQMTYLPDAILLDATVTLTCIPTALIFVSNFIKSSHRRHDIMI